MSGFLKIFILIYLTIQLKFLLSNHSKGDDLHNLKRDCEHFFSKNDYRKALTTLNQIIKLEPNDYRNYFQRATASFALFRHKKAISDLKIVITKNSNYIPGLIYLAKSQAYLCELKNAIETYKKVISKTKGEERERHKASLLEIKKVNLLADNADKFKCEQREKIQQVAAVCEYYFPVNIKLARCYSEAKMFNELGKIANKLLKIDPNDMESYLMLAEANFQQGRINVASKVVKRGLQKDPENRNIALLHKKIFKITSLDEEAKALKGKSKNIKAVSRYEELLELIPTNTHYFIDVQTELCKLNSLIGRAEKTIELCSAVLNSDSNSIIALKSRAKAFMVMQKFDEAAIDFKRVNRIDPNDREVINGYQEAKMKAEQAELKDYYAILEIPRNADKQQIKKAYRKLALKWHPDRWKKEEEKKIAEKKFSDINEANKVLSDDNLRRRYNAGENVHKQGANSGYNFQSEGSPFQFKDANGNTFFFNF